MSLTNKIDFAVILEVKNANPNGDPLDGNRPRTNYDGIGEISDVCIKRKLRDRLMENGKSIFVQSDDRKIDDCTSLRARAEKVLDNSKNAKENAALACAKWFDVRAFGQVFAFSGGKGKGKKKEEEDASTDDKAVSIGIRGPVTIQPAFSRSEVNITSTQITKSVNSEEGKNGKRSSDTMGMKHRIDTGIYAFFGSMNPQLATRTDFSDDDASVIKSLLPKLFENDASSARPEGSMRVLKLIWWQHNCPSGQTSSAKVHGTLQVSKDGSISFSSKELNVTADGTISIGNSVLKPEIIEGF